jgi:hypothetical protein
MSVVGTYFSKRRSLALAICAIGNSVGGLVFAAILQNMIPSVGFGWAIRTCGFLVMVSVNFSERNFLFLLFLELCCKYTHKTCIFYS